MLDQQAQNSTLMDFVSWSAAKPADILYGHLNRIRTCAFANALFYY